MILRAARESDCAAMARIYAPYVTDTDISWEETPPDAEEFARRLREHAAQGFPWLATEQDGRVLGYAYAGRFGARGGYDWDAELSVYIDADARRRGAGKALYAALLACLRRQGYVNAYALVTSPNPGSEAFHTALGFRRAALLPGAGRKLGRWVGLAYYHLQLAPYADGAPRPAPMSARDAEEYLALHGLDGAPRAVIETPRLILREMTQADFPELCAVLCDDGVMTAYGGAFDRAMVQDWMCRQRARYDEHGFGLWLAVEKSTGRAAGQIGVTIQSWPGHGDVFETGWLLRADTQHRGFATEGGRACVRYIRDTLGAQHAYAIIRDTNLPSQRVALRLGMAARGRFTKRWRGEEMPHIVFST